MSFLKKLKRLTKRENLVNTVVFGASLFILVVAFQNCGDSKSLRIVGEPQPYPVGTVSPSGTESPTGTPSPTPSGTEQDFPATLTDTASAVSDTLPFYVNPTPTIQVSDVQPADLVQIFTASDCRASSTVSLQATVSDDATTVDITTNTLQFGVLYNFYVQVTQGQSEPVCENTNIKYVLYRALAVGSSHVCHLSTAGQVKCWGANQHGQLGQNDTNDRGGNSGDMAALNPIDLGTDRKAKVIATGAAHTCGLLDDHSVKCWGWNGHGELGQDGTVKHGSGESNAKTVAELPPINLGEGLTAKSLTAGDHHTCVLLDDDSVKCFGNNDRGQLGQDDTVLRGGNSGDMAALNPIDLGSDDTGGTTVAYTAKAISADGNHTCAILNNDTLKCWGANGQGQLGQNDTDDRGENSGDMAALTSIDLGAGRLIKSVSTGHAHTCAILDNDEAKCWGWNGHGELGQDDTAKHGSGNSGTKTVATLSGIDLGSGRTAQMVSAGDHHTCVVLDDNSAKCFGNNDKGQLGQNDTNLRGGNSGDMASLNAMNFGTNRTVQSIYTGTQITCAILDLDEVKCFGHNNKGQLGQDDTDDRGHSTSQSIDAINPINL